MTKYIVLDSGPLWLLTQKVGQAEADACRRWAAAHETTGVRLIVPDLADYEVRRELTRKRAVGPLARLDAYVAAQPGRHLPLTSAAMRLAARLWADVRQHGVPTADPKELDGDAILAAQVLDAGLPVTETVVATTNAVHIVRFHLDARSWSTI